MQFLLGKELLENKYYKFMIIVSFCLIVKTCFANGYTNDPYMVVKEAEKETFLGSLTNE